MPRAFQSSNTATISWLVMPTCCMEAKASPQIWSTAYSPALWNIFTCVGLPWRVGGSFADLWRMLDDVPRAVCIKCPRVTAGIKVTSLLGSLHEKPAFREFHAVVRDESRGMSHSIRPQAVFDTLFDQILSVFGLPKLVSFPSSQNDSFKSQPFRGIRPQNWACLFQNFGSSRLFGLPNRSPSGGEASEMELIWHQSVVVTVVPLREVTFIEVLSVQRIGVGTSKS